MATEEKIEAAAKALFHKFLGDSGGRTGWHAVAPPVRDHYSECAKVALEAAEQIPTAVEAS